MSSLGERIHEYIDGWMDGNRVDHCPRSPQPARRTPRRRRGALRRRHSRGYRVSLTAMDMFAGSHGGFDHLDDAMDYYRSVTGDHAATQQPLF